MVQGLTLWWPRVGFCAVTVQRYPRPPTDFWPQFLAECWHQKPCVFPKLIGDPFITESELIETLQATAFAIVNGRDVRFRAYRQNDNLDAGHELIGCNPRPGISIFDEYSARVRVGHQITAAHELVHFVPKAGVSSLDDYAAHVLADLGSETFGVIVDNLEVVLAEYVPSIWWRSREWLSPLIEHIGVPNSFNIVPFVGNYRYTPFGIHRDAEHVFTFPVLRAKTMLLWPPNRFVEGQDFLPSAEPGAQSDNVLLHPDEAEGDAILLRAEPGDMMYWPGGWWHCGASKSVQVQATLTLGINPNFSVSELVIDTVHKALGTANGRNATPVEALDAFEKLVSIGELRRLIESAALRHASARGMPASPPMATGADVSLGDSLRPIASCPLLIASEGTRVFANNQQIDAGFDGAERIVSRLRSAEWTPVGALCRDCDTAHALSLLSALVRAGAVEHRAGSVDRS